MNEKTIAPADADDDCVIQLDVEGLAEEPELVGVLKFPIRFDADGKARFAPKEQP